VDGAARPETEGRLWQSRERLAHAAVNPCFILVRYDAMMP
jgi:hypothetical protein